MKLLTTICFTAFACITYSQSTSKDLTKNVSSEIITTAEQDSIKTVKLNILHNLEVNKEISQIDSHLNSIQFKWDYIENDPIEKKIADENGWFTDMTDIRSALEEKKLVLINSLK